MKKNYLPEIVTIIIILGSIFLSFFIEPATAIGFVVGAYYMLFGTDIGCYSLLLFLFPYAEIFDINLIPTSLFTLLEIAFVGRKFLLDAINGKAYNISIYLYIFYCAVVSLFTKNFSVIELIKQAMNFLLCYFFITDYKEERMEEYVVFYCMGNMTSAIMGLWKESIPGFILTYDRDLVYEWINGVRTLRFSATFNDPNFYTISVITSLGLIIYLFMSGKGKTIHLLLATAIAVMALQTYSKSYLLMLAALFVLVIYLLYKHRKTGIILGCAVCGTLLLLSGAFQGSTAIQGTLSRFSQKSYAKEDSVINQLTSGRWEIWTMYFDYMTSDVFRFLFGNGISVDYYHGKATHNFLVELWYYLGLIGSCLYFYTVSDILSSRKLIKRRLVNGFLLIMVIAMFLFLAIYKNSEMPFYLIASWIALNTQLLP